MTDIASPHPAAHQVEQERDGEKATLVTVRRGEHQAGGADDQMPPPARLKPEQDEDAGPDQQQIEEDVGHRRDAEDQAIGDRDR